MSCNKALYVCFLLLALFCCNTGLVFAQAPVISYQPPQQTYPVNSLISPLAPKNTGGAVPPNYYGQVTTFAGNGVAGSANNSVGTLASISGPLGLAMNAAGDIYVGDYNNCVIRKITPASSVTTFAGMVGAHGTTDGVGQNARFTLPQGLATDKNGNIFVADSYNNTIREIIPAGYVSTFAGVAGVIGSMDGPGTTAEFNTPAGVAADNAGNVYVADQNNNMIRKITPAGYVTTLAGSTVSSSSDGTGSAAHFNSPGSLVVDASGNIYVTDDLNNLIRKIDPAGVVTTFAGTGVQGATDGPAATATFYNPHGITIDKYGTLYITDEKNNVIRKISKGIVSTIAGNGSGGSQDGIAKNATFSFPGSITYDNNGNVFVGDINDYHIRKISLTGYTIDKPLPAGLNFDPTTGIISGTPTVLSPPVDYTVTAYNVDGSSSTVVSIAVTSSQLTFAPLPAKTVCDPDFDPGATGDGTITYTSSNTAVATIVGGKIHITGPGTSNITANGTSQIANQLTVNAAVTPSITIYGPDGFSCQGEQLLFRPATVENPGNNATYQWQVNGVNQGGNNQLFITSDLKNNDQVRCILTSSETCTTSQTAISNTITVSINPQVTASVSISSSVTEAVCPGIPVTFTATAVTSDPNPTYQWQINGEAAGTNNPVFTSKNFANGDVVTCTLTSTGNCIVNANAVSNAVTVPISTAGGCTLNIPNVFTPNGDHVNDAWDIYGLQNYPRCTVGVYNRYGALVFNSPGYARAWDGTRNGANLPAGTYYYIIDLKNGDKPKTGVVVILR